MAEFFTSLIENMGGTQIVGMVMTSIIAFAAVGAFIFNGLNNRKIERSNRITADKEKVDRALEFIERFDEKRYMRLLAKKYNEYPKTITELKSKGKLDKKVNFLSTFTEAQDEIHYFLFLMDTIAILFNKNKIDKDMFRSKLGDYFISFYLNFKEEIFDIIEGIKESDKTFYYYRNYLELIIEILEKRIRKDPTKRDEYDIEIKNCRALLK